MQEIKLVLCVLWLGTRRVWLLTLVPHTMRSKNHLYIWNMYGVCSWGQRLSKSSLQKSWEEWGRLISLPFLTYHWSTSPPALMGKLSATTQRMEQSYTLPSSIHDVWRDPLNKWASVPNTLFQRLSFLSSNPVTGITRQHCDVLFSVRCLS